jgi:hydroxyethylthiazole kinase
VASSLLVHLGLPTSEQRGAMLEAVEATNDAGTPWFLDPIAARGAATHLAATTHGIVAVAGPVDLITDVTDFVRIANGHTLLTKVTGGGCALGAVIAALAAIEDDRFSTTVAAATVYTIAAEIAAPTAAGSRSFAVGSIDALASIKADEIGRRGRDRRAGAGEGRQGAQGTPSRRG